jgi:hypothetical protein
MIALIYYCARRNVYPTFWAKNIGSIGVSGRSNMINGSMLLMAGVSGIEDLRG